MQIKVERLRGRVRWLKMRNNVVAKGWTLLIRRGEGNEATGVKSQSQKRQARVGNVHTNECRVLEVEIEKGLEVLTE
jgi:hypothetical protein